MFPIFLDDWLPYAGLFEKIDHIGMVVRNLENTVKSYEAVGMTPWKQIAPPSYCLSGHDHISSDVYPGHKFAIAKIGGIKLMLCEPLEDDSPQWKHISQRGEGVFYVGFDALDINYSEKIAARFGLDVEFRLKMPDGRKFTKFKCKDTSAVFGIGLNAHR